MAERRLALHDWTTTRPDALAWTCGYCHRFVSSKTGWRTEHHAAIRICPNCNVPTFFDDHGSPHPGEAAAEPVGHLPLDVQQLYEEARTCTTVHANSAAVLLCRKIIMHVAVEKGAKPNQGFLTYVDYLDSSHHIPVGAKTWVDYMRKRGNHETHEIVVASADEARGVLTFAMHLLRNVYELPGIVPPDP